MYNLSVGRIIHVKSNELACRAAIVTVKPDKSGRAGVTIFSQSMDAQRGVIYAMWDADLGWYDPAGNWHPAQDCPYDS